MKRVSTLTHKYGRWQRNRSFIIGEYATIVQLAEAAKGNPATTTIVTMMFYIFFSVAEAEVEKMIFNERFAHWLDPLFACAFIAYSAYAVYNMRQE